MARMLAPQCSVPASGQASTQSGWRLPASLLTEQVRRLAICAAVGATLWAYGLVMDAFARPLTLGTAVPIKNVAIEVLAIAVSGLMLLYVRLSRHPAQTKIDMALLYFVLNAFAVALLIDWSRSPSGPLTGLLSWNPVVILIAAMTIPASPAKMLAAAVVAASTDPLAVWIAHLRGVSVPGTAGTLVLFMANYACAAVAVLPSRVLQRIGQTLRQAQDMGSYRLEELLGRGGMGEVWRASHRLLARSAAIKLVRPELMGAANETEAEKMICRFGREAQATAALNSPHTIRLFDFGVTEDRTFYYVMELLTGRDLASLVREAGPLPEGRVVYLLRQVCHSLAEAHAHGLVHRDVTPTNIYACRMGLDYDFVKVLDFGLVSFSDPQAVGRSLMTGTHGTTGTPAFMAPEVILEGAVDARADIYAVGCVAYYLLTGTLVFEADSPMKMFLEHLQTPPVPPSQRSEQPIGRELDTLVLHCLSKDPGSRPQSAAELLSRLDRLPRRETWDNPAARDWWERHFVELATPAAVQASACGSAPAPAPAQLQTTLLATR